MQSCVLRLTVKTPLTATTKQKNATSNAVARVASLMARARKPEEQPEITAASSLSKACARDVDVASGLYMQFMSDDLRWSSAHGMSHDRQITVTVSFDCAPGDTVKGPLSSLPRVLTLCALLLKRCCA